MVFCIQFDRYHDVLQCVAYRRIAISWYYRYHRRPIMNRIISWVTLRLNLAATNTVFSHKWLICSLFLLLSINLVFKMSKTCEKCSSQSPKSQKVTTLSGFFCPTTSQKHTDSSFTIINDKQKQQMAFFVIAVKRLINYTLQLYELQSC